VDEVIDEIYGTDSRALGVLPGIWLPQFAGAVDAGGAPIFNKDPGMLSAAVSSTDPDTAVEPESPALDSVPDDPLCS
jgi:hypothetical protein